ncbi:hypothetical protein ACGF0D_00930 [Kitasatospora sp. NPDC048298]|uniref:hypothetical protein n=1 Tax=Kitasatospora sp. NPDC048298 TaxID=3364049 RepID=UPI00371A63AB
MGASRDYLDGNLPAVLAASIEAGLINMSKGFEKSLADVSPDNPWRIFRRAAECGGKRFSPALRHPAAWSSRFQKPAQIPRSCFFMMNTSCPW